MDAEKVNVYKACDKAIHAMNRENVEAFGRLKSLAKSDQLNVIRTVVTVYQESARKARKRYRKVGDDAYLLGLLLCGITGQEASRMAESAITDEWIATMLSEPDPVTLYSFDAETERKAYRLEEALEVTDDRNAEIDRALRYWSLQLAQYAINATDYALVQAYMDAGIEEVRWITQRDEKVCKECRPRDGKVYPIDEVPVKHMRCRCLLIPVIE